MLRAPLLSLALFATLALTSIATAGDPDHYTVHEWGTFTVLQDEAGNCLPGVNVNEEKLPAFVHRLWSGATRNGGARAPLTRGRSKGIPTRFVSATMRMETPIIYIYPPAQQSGEPLDVSVDFNGGWLSEWYPDAQVSAPGLVDREKFVGELSAGSTGSLLWHDVKFDTGNKPPETDHHVWLAPRQVATPLLSTPEGQTEKYLFYRGIAALEAPVRVVRNHSRDQLVVKANEVAGASPEEMQQFWLVDVRADGAVAYRSVQPSLADRKAGTFATLPATFAESDYAKSHLTELRSHMKQVLREEGLFEDEAEAMLRTWELSYFKSAGLRLFFTLPRTWTDHVLPLNVSQEADIERVMIGRIEIITPAQRATLQELAKASISSPDWLWHRLDKMPPEQQREIMLREDQVFFPFEELGIEVPADYQLYIDLGRFRDALLLDAIKRGEAGSIQLFASQYRLGRG